MRAKRHNKECAREMCSCWETFDTEEHRPFIFLLLCSPGPHRIFGSNLHIRLTQGSCIRIRSMISKSSRRHLNIERRRIRGGWRRLPREQLSIQNWQHCPERTLISLATARTLATSWSCLACCALKVGFSTINSAVDFFGRPPTPAQVRPVSPSARLPAEPQPPSVRPTSLQTYDGLQKFPVPHLCIRLRPSAVPVWSPDPSRPSVVRLPHAPHNRKPVCCSTTSSSRLASLIRSSAALFDSQVTREIHHPHGDEKGILTGTR